MVVFDRVSSVMEAQRAKWMDSGHFLVFQGQKDVGKHAVDGGNLAPPGM